MPGQMAVQRALPSDEVGGNRFREINRRGLECVAVNVAVEVAAHHDPPEAMLTIEPLPFPTTPGNKARTVRCAKLATLGDSCARRVIHTVEDQK
jgi:hypothetical protein